MEAEEQSPTTKNDQQAHLLTSLSEEQRALAMERFAVVRLTVEEGLPQAKVAREYHILLRNLQRWIALYRKRGLVGLARSTRTDKGTHRHLTTNQIYLIEGIALQKPKPSIATVHRKVIALAQEQGWKPRAMMRCTGLLNVSIQGSSPSLMKAKKRTAIHSM